MRYLMALLLCLFTPHVMAGETNRVTGHSIVKRLPGKTLVRFHLEKEVRVQYPQNFNAPVASVPLCAVIPNRYMQKGAVTARIFWHGDLEEVHKADLSWRCDDIVKMAYGTQNLSSNTIRVLRPYNYFGRGNWRIGERIAVHRALVEYLCATMELCQFHLMSHSGGASIAFRLATSPMDKVKVKSLTLSAPGTGTMLYVVPETMKQLFPNMTDGEIASLTSRNDAIVARDIQETYSPRVLNRIPANIPITVIWNRNDPYAREMMVMPLMNALASRGTNFKWVEPRDKRGANHYHAHLLARYAPKPVWK